MLLLIYILEFLSNYTNNIFRCVQNNINMPIIKIKDLKNWESSVINSKIPVFVDFWAEWCGPCRMIGPIVEELSTEYDGKINFVKVNVDESNELASKYNIFSIPTLLIFNNGKLIDQQVGAASKESYKNMINRILENKGEAN